jgi:hypothetical protein
VKARRDPSRLMWKLPPAGFTRGNPVLLNIERASPATPVTRPQAESASTATEHCRADIRRESPGRPVSTAAWTSRAGTARTAPGRRCRRLRPPGFGQLPAVRSPPGPSPIGRLDSPRGLVSCHPGDTTHALQLSVASGQFKSQSAALNWKPVN